MSRFKTTPQSFREILQNGFNLYWEGIQTLWLWSLVLAVVSNIPNWIMVYFIKQRYSMKTLIGVDIFCLIFVPFIAFLMAYIMYQLFLIGSQSKKSSEEVISLILNRLILLSVALFVNIFVSSLGLALLIVPGIFIAVMLTFVQPLILFDDNSLIDAYKNSWNLVKSNWWHIFTVLTVPIVLMVIAAPSLYSGNPSVIHIIFDVIRMAIVTPLLFAFILTMFYDAKARHNVPMHLPRVRKTKEKTTGHASAKAAE